MSKAQRGSINLVPCFSVVVLLILSLNFAPMCLCALVPLLF